MQDDISGTMAGDQIKTGFSPEGFLNCAQGTAGIGSNIRVKDAKGRIAEYIRHDYIEESGEPGFYYVTDFALERFASWGWKPGEFDGAEKNAPSKENEPTSVSAVGSDTAVAGAINAPSAPSNP